MASVFEKKFDLKFVKSSVSYCLKLKD
jgi:hypothetical protein